jgi:hypothetical protein
VVGETRRRKRYENRNRTTRKIRGFDENVKIHPIILVKFFPQLYVLARRTRLPASFFV